MFTGCVITLSLWRERTTVMPTLWASKERGRMNSEFPIQKGEPYK